MADEFDAKEASGANIAFQLIEVFNKSSSVKYGASFIHPKDNSKVLPGDIIHIIVFLIKKK